MKNKSVVLVCLLIFFNVTPAFAKDQWASFAIEMTDPTGDSGATMAIGFIRRDTRDEANALALSLCRQKSSQPQNCKTLDDYNRGCLYLAMGRAPWGGGPLGWGSGPTPQEAYDKCHANNLNCDVPVFGGCSDTAKDVSRDAIVRAPKVRYWGALAVGSGEDATYKYLAVSSGSGPTEEAAKRKAVDVCNAKYKNGEVSCGWATTFNTGCGYIARAYSNPGGKLGWGTGTTAQAAYDRCTSNGSLCKTDTTGFCIEE